MSSFLLRSDDASALTTDSNMLVNEACACAAIGLSLAGAGEELSSGELYGLRIDLKDLASTPDGGRARVDDGVDKADSGL